MEDRRRDELTETVTRPVSVRAAHTAAGVPALRIVAAANALTERWARRCDGGTVIAGCGVWPLVAILAAGAGDEARVELEAAIGIPAADGISAAALLLSVLQSSKATRAALGTWVTAGLPVYPEWQQSLPAGTWERLRHDGTDQGRLDAWARRQTDGLIPRMPVAIEEDTLLVLASALLVRTSWLQPFEPGQASFPFEAPAGPWRGRPQIARLNRESSELDDLLIAASRVGPLTLVEVRGDKDISVYLAIADEAAGPGAVVGGATRIVGGLVEGRRGSSLREGDTAPGLTVDVVPSFQPDPVLHLSTVPFRIDADHDLLRHGDIFGLEAASDDSRGHFPRISPEPLAIRQAKQVATAAFSAEGFEAAAVTAMGVVPGAATFQPGQKRLVVSVRFDRPFAFVAVHRPSRLVLVAGWVADPQPAGAE